MKWVGRLVSLALILGSLWYFDANPRALLFAFILFTIVQTFLITWFMHLGRSPRYRRWIESWTRRPTEKESKWAKNYLVMENAAADLRSILLLIGGLSLFAFFLAHVDEHKELNFDLATFADEILLAVALTGVYVAESLVLRETALDLDQPEAMNLHYGSSRITVLALAVLFAGAGVAFLQISGREVTPWVIMVPLVVMKFLFESSRSG